MADDKACGDYSPAQHKQTKIQDLANNPALLAIVQKHAEELNAAGVHLVTIETTDRNLYRENSMEVIGKAELTTITPAGGNTDASISAMRAIRRDLEEAGLEKFSEAATMRCGGPILLMQERPVKTSQSR